MPENTLCNELLLSPLLINHSRNTVASLEVYCPIDLLPRHSVRGKRVCRFHGGKSTGPKTKEGRKRCGIAKTVHGGETRAIRAAQPAKMAELKMLEKIIEKW
jgi:hypothetical protein